MPIVLLPSYRLPRWAHLWGAVVLLALAACSAQPGAGQAGPPGTVLTAATPSATEPLPPKPLCRALPSHLDRLVQAADPAAVARANSLDYRNGRVKVTVALRVPAGTTVPESELAGRQRELARRYGLDITGSFLRSFNAWARPVILCDLASDPEVAIVDSPNLLRPAR